MAALAHCASQHVPAGAERLRLQLHVCLERVSNQVRGQCADVSLVMGTASAKYGETAWRLHSARSAFLKTVTALRPQRQTNNSMPLSENKLRILGVCQHLYESVDVGRAMRHWCAVYVVSMQAPAERSGQ